MQTTSVRADEFVHKKTFSSGGYSPSAITTGDFNRDGLVDLAITNETTNTVGVLLGRGGGSFSSAVIYPVGSFPTDITTSDLVNNGLTDLIVANGGSGTIGVLFGNGDGTFQAEKEVAEISGVYAVVAGDFNNDGNPDIAAVQPLEKQGSNVWILLGNGDGTFRDPVAYQTGAESLKIAIGDFNNDRNLDLATADYNEGVAGGISILLGNGDGTFKTAQAFGTPLAPLSLVVADFNHDGNEDLAAGTFSNPGFSVLLGAGDGTFGKPILYGLQAPFTSITSGDFNGDGSMDVAGVGDTGHGDAGNVNVALGLGDGTFLSATSYACCRTAGQVVSANLNHDRYPELVVTDTRSEGLASIMINSDHLPAVALSKDALFFGKVKLDHTSPLQSVTLTNTGFNTLDISKISASEYFIQKNNCGSELSIRASCKIRITFRPRKLGKVNGRVYIADNAKPGRQSIDLHGAGIN